MKEIKSADWDKFWARLSDHLKGGRVSIEHIDPSTGRGTTVVSDAAMQRLQWDTSGDCSNKLTIQAGEKGGTSRAISHLVTEPIHVKLEQNGDSADWNPLRIEAEDGTTLVTCRPAIHESLLKDLQIF